MIRRLLFAALLAWMALIGGGCSEKNYFEPEDVKGAVQYDGELPGEIVEIGYAGATLDNGQVITKEGLQSFRLPEGYRFIARSGSLVAAAGDCKPNIVYDLDTNESIPVDLPRRMVAAMFIPDSTVLAFVIEGNSYGLYDYVEKRMIAKYDSDPAITADIRIANPMMLDQLVLIPTLDGKLAIVNKSTGGKIREIVVGKGEEFNNIIYLNVIGNRLVAATPHRIISVSPKIMDAQSMEIADVIFVADAIYILSKDGTVYHCDVDLKILHSKKFPFAHFVGAIYGEFIYIVEREGFIIATDPLLTVANVFELPDRIDKWFFTTPSAFYYDRWYFKLNTAEADMEGTEAEAEGPGSGAAEAGANAGDSGEDEASLERGAASGAPEEAAQSEEEESWFSDIWKALKKMTEPDESNETIRSDD
ncbi:hypothetical protein [Hydrogenimonas sp.]